VRAIQSATNLRDVYEGVLRASEALIVVLGVVSTTWAREYAVRTPQLDDLGQAILGGGASLPAARERRSTAAIRAERCSTENGFVR